MTPFFWSMVFNLKVVDLMEFDIGRIRTKFSYQVRRTTTCVSSLLFFCQVQFERRRLKKFTPSSSTKLIILKQEEIAAFRTRKERVGILRF
jgi:hypothetical protein